MGLAVGPTPGGPSTPPLPPSPLGLPGFPPPPPSLVHCIVVYSPLRIHCLTLLAVMLVPNVIGAVEVGYMMVVLAVVVVVVVVAMLLIKSYCMLIIAMLEC
jgi:hypothetical protein